MSAVESPLETLAFNYLNFGLFTALNNIWAWVTVITAAFSLWRIKTSSRLLKSATRGEFNGDASPLQKVLFVPPSEQVESVPANNETSTTSPATTITSLSPRVLDKEGGTTKGRFTAYFEHDDVNHSNHADKKDRDEFKILSQWIQNDTFCSNYVEEWYESWEKMIRTRKGEMGWYNYQDLMVIDGNIVRLWEGCRRWREAEATDFLGGVVETW